MKGYALGIDTSEKYLGVFLFHDDTLVDRIAYEAWQRQSEYLVSEVDQILKRNGVSRHDIVAVSATKGPGSYTGVRIGLTVAKTIAFALKIPLFLLSSLECLQVYPRPCVCLSNARSKRSYFGVYVEGRALIEDCVKPNEEVKAYLSAHPDYLPCGDLSYLGLEGTPYAPEDNFLRCFDERHRQDNPFSAAPIYLKDEYGTTNLKTIVRKTIASDVPAILEIQKATFPSPYTEEQMHYALYENPFSHIYTAVLGSEVVGFIDFMITFSSCSINLIAVKEEYRHKGIGNLLLGQLLRDCEAAKEEVEFVTLEVRASNLPAQAFYKKHRFQVATIKKAYYENGEDALYMIRSLVHG